MKIRNTFALGVIAILIGKPVRFLFEHATGVKLVGFWDIIIVFFLNLIVLTFLYSVYRHFKAKVRVKMGLPAEPPVKPEKEAKTYSVGGKEYKSKS